MLNWKTTIRSKLLSGYFFAVSISVLSISLSVFLVTQQKSSNTTSVFIELKPEPVVDADYPVYRVQKVQYFASHLTAVLKRESSGKNQLGENIEYLNFQATYIEKNIIRVKITDKLNKIWQGDQYNFTSMYSINNYDLKLNNYPFGFEIRNKKEDLSVFNTIGHNFYFSEEYLEIGTTVNEWSFRFGVGERKGSLKMNFGKYPVWPNSENQGHHPFYIELFNKSASGVYFHNFNAIEIENSKNFLKFRSTGGILDIFVFIGENVEEVIRSYHSVTGFPSLPQYSDLGYHYGEAVSSGDDLEKIFELFNENRIPVDKFWLKDYSLAEKSFDVLPEFLLMPEIFKKYETEVVLEISSEVTEKSDYFSVVKDISLPYTARNDSGKCSYIDWFYSNSSIVWLTILKDLKKSLNFSSIFLTKNEVSGTKNSPSEYPGFNASFCLDCDTIPVSTPHINNFKEISLHSLWGDMQIQNSLGLFLEKNTRPSIFSASTRPGSKALHVFFPVRASWDLFKESLYSVLSFDFFGIRAGANLCGHKNLGRLELCLKWHQAHLFFPMMINLKKEAAAESRLFDKTLIDGVREVIKTRYQLSLAIYSLFFEASIHGGTVVRPLIFEFSEHISLNYLNEVMLGSNILGIFSVNEGDYLISVYFPKVNWFNLNTGKKERPDIRNVDISRGCLLYIREGSAVPIVNGQVSRISQIGSQNISIILALNSKFESFGSFYVDDGVSADTIKSKKFTKVVIRSSKSETINIKVSSVIKGYENRFKFIDSLKIFGCPQPSFVKVNNQSLDFTFNSGVLEFDLLKSTFSVIEIKILIV